MPSDASSAVQVGPAERGIRRVLAVTLALGIIGVSADLLLLDHVEGATQLIPVVLLGLMAAILCLHAIVRRAGTVRLSQVAFVLCIACGGLGAYLHFQGNAEFQLEIDPDLSQRELFWKALRAKAPPALAPLAFVQLGLVGLAWSYRHPRLRSRSDTH